GYYEYDSRIFSLMVKADATITYQVSTDGGTTFKALEEEQLFQFFNYRYGMLEVYKTAVLNKGTPSETKVWVEGVKFNVYEAIPDDDGKYISGDNKYKKGELVASG